MYCFLLRCFIHKRAKQCPFMLCCHDNRLLPMAYFIVTMLVQFWHNLHEFSFSSLQDCPLFLKEQNLDQYRVVMISHFLRTYNLKERAIYVFFFFLRFKLISSLRLFLTPFIYFIQS